MQNHDCSRWHRSVDGRKAIMISLFESVEAHASWLKKADFSEHLSKLDHLVESAEGGFYTLEESVGAMMNIY